MDEDGEISLISLISKTVLHKLRTNRTISAVAFSPDGKRFAFTKENLVQVLNLIIRECLRSFSLFSFIAVIIVSKLCIIKCSTFLASFLHYNL